MPKLPGGVNAKKLLDAMADFVQGPVNPQTLTRPAKLKHQVDAVMREAPKAKLSKGGPPIGLEAVSARGGVSNPIPTPDRFRPPATIPGALPAAIPGGDAAKSNLLKKLLLGAGATTAAGAGGAGAYYGLSGGAASPAATAAAAQSIEAAAPGLLSQLAGFGGTALNFAKSNPGTVAAGVGAPLAAYLLYQSMQNQEEKAASFAENLGRLLARS